MKVQSLDYSPIQNAINSKYAAKSGEFVTRGIDIATEGAGLAKKSAQLSKKSLEINREYQQKQEGLQMASIAIQGVQALAQLGSSIYSCVKAKNQEQSKTDLLNFQSSFKSALQTSIDNGDTSIDQFGHINYGEDVKSFYDNYTSSIDEKKWDTETKQAHINSALEIFNNSDTLAASLINQKYSSEWYIGFQDNLAKSQAIDLGNYSFDQLQLGDIPETERYAAGYAEIDSQVKSGTLSVQSAAIEKANYKRSVDNATGQAVMTQVAQQGGNLVQVGDWLKNNYGLTDAEVNTLIKQAQVSESNYIEQTLIPTSNQAMKASLDSYGTDSYVSPQEAKEAMRETLKAQGQSESHIEQVIDAMDDQQYLWNQNRLLEVNSDIETMPIGELLATKENLETDQKGGWYSGSSESLYVKTHDNVLSAISSRNKEVTEAQEQELAQLQTYIDAVEADPNLSTTEKISKIQFILDDERTKEKGGLNMLDSYEDDLYMMKAIKTLNKQEVDEVYQPYVDQVIEAIAYDYATNQGYNTSDGKITYKDLKKGDSALTQKTKVSQVKAEAQIALARVIDGYKNGTYKNFTEFKNACSEVQNQFTSGLLGTLTESTFTSGSSAQSILDAISRVEDYAVINKNGVYTFNSSELESDYNTMAEHEAKRLQEVYGKDVLAANFKYEVNIGGTNKVYPYPVYTTTDGEKIVRTNEGFFKVDPNIDIVKHPEQAEKINVPTPELSANVQTAIASANQAASNANADPTNKKKQAEAMTEAYKVMGTVYGDNKYSVPKQEKNADINNLVSNLSEAMNSTNLSDVTKARGDIYDYYISQGMTKKEAKAKELEVFKSTANGKRSK